MGPDNNDKSATDTIESNAATIIPTIKLITKRGRTITIIGVIIIKPTTARTVPVTAPITKLINQNITMLLRFFVMKSQPFFILSQTAPLFNTEILDAKV